MLEPKSQDHKQPTELLELLRGDKWQEFCYSVEESQRMGDEPVSSPGLLRVRTGLVVTLLDRQFEPEQVVAGLSRAVDDCARCWSYKPQPHIKKASKTAGRMRPPAFFRRLAEPRFEGAFQPLSADYGWLHPGLLMAGQTAAYIYDRGSSPKPEFEVKTWILLAGVEAGLPAGFLAELTLRRIPDGCGVHACRHPAAVQARAPSGRAHAEPRRAGHGVRVGRVVPGRCRGNGPVSTRAIPAPARCDARTRERTVRLVGQHPARLPT